MSPSLNGHFALPKNISQKSGFLLVQPCKPRWNGHKLRFSYPCNKAICTGSESAGNLDEIGICTGARVDSLVFGKIFFWHEVAPPNLLEPRALVALGMYPIWAHVLGCDGVFAQQPPKVVWSNRLSPFGPGRPRALLVRGELLDQGRS